MQNASGRSSASSEVRPALGHHMPGAPEPDHPALRRIKPLRLTETINRRPQIDGLIRQIACGGKNEVGGTIGVLGRRGRAGDASGDAFRSGGSLSDTPGYFDRGGILLADGGSNRRGEAVDLAHDRGNGADIVDCLPGCRLHLGDLGGYFFGRLGGNSAIPCMRSRPRSMTPRSSCSVPRANGFHCIDRFGVIARATARVCRHANLPHGARTASVARRFNNSRSRLLRARSAASSNAARASSRRPSFCSKSPRTLGNR